MRAATAPLDKLNSEEVDSLVLLRTSGGNYDLRTLEHCAQHVHELADVVQQQRSSYIFDDKHLEGLRVLLDVLVCSSALAYILIQLDSFTLD